MLLIAAITFGEMYSAEIFSRENKKQVRRYFLLSIFIFLLFPFSLLAQTKKDSTVASQIHELEKVWIRYRILILDKMPDGYLSAAVKIFTPERAAQDNDLKYKNAWQQARAGKYDHDPGLEWNSNFFQNFKPSNDDEQDLIYRQRFQTVFKKIPVKPRLKSLTVN